MNQFNPLSQQTCPSENDISASTEKCQSVGGSPSVSFSGNCKVPQCIQGKSNRPPCPEDADSSIKQRITQECQQRGGQTYASFDPQGCTITVCGGQGVSPGGPQQPGQSGPNQPNAQISQGGAQQQSQTNFANTGICSKSPPVQAVTNCQQQGGQLVTGTDQNGCITNAQCITRGDITDTYVETVSQVPDTGVLLDVAFSMEQLKMKLDQMSRQTGDIAAYYQSVGSTDAQKYTRVSQMFLAAKTKVGDIQTELRGRLNGLNTDDITKVKSDVRYVKDVMLKDALYLMLTNDNSDTQSITTQSATSQAFGRQPAIQVSGNDCGNNGYCFDQAVRICKPVKFQPDPSAPTITIVGLQGNSCVVEMVLAENQGPPAGAIPGVNPPYTAECKLTDYALGFGIRGPQDMSKYCTGSLVEMAKGFSGSSGQGGAQRAPQGGLNQPLPQQQVQQPVTRR